MGNCFSTSRAAITQSHDITTGEQSSRNILNNTTLASAGAGFPAAQIFSISGSQFTEVHGNVCNSCLGVTISIIMATLRSTTIMQQLLLMLYHLCLLWGIQALCSQVVTYTQKSSRITFPLIPQDKGNHFFCMVWEALAKHRFASNLLKSMKICKCYHAFYLIWLNYLM